VTTSDPRAVLARHGLLPKRSWGQNFLVDRRVHARIAAAAAATAEDVVVEIGAGVGTLTAALLSDSLAPRRLLAVERDPDMVAVLRAELQGEPRVELRAEDATAFDFAAAARAAGRPVVVVGNRPYQITSALLFALVDAGPAISRAVVMVQRELGARVVAPPGSKTYGRLSVMVQQRMQTRVLFHVPAGAFHPRPKVVSSVLSLVPRAEPLAPVRDQATFARMVGELFSTRRKMLRRTLTDAFGEETARAALGAAEVAGTRRPEELSIADLARLADALLAAGERIC
jgi:16S rRNA (adenine1518-N6/adenine1519-N6)-dimethyltransferase